MTMAGGTTTEKYSFRLDSETATGAFAAALASVCEAGDVIGLVGDLGAGKTARARAFIGARTGITEVPSPTFTLVQVYDDEAGSGPAIWHLDLYRLDAPGEVAELGLEEAMANGILLIEWPERIADTWLDDWLQVELQFAESDDARDVVISAHGARSARLLTAAAKTLPP